MARTDPSTGDPVTPQPPYARRSKRQSEAAPDKDYPDTTITPQAAREPDPDLYKEWQKLNEEAQRRRNPWIPIWQTIYQLTLPQRENFFDIAPGQQLTDFIYDETAVVGVPRLASRLTSGFFPEAGELFTLAFGNDAPDHLQGPDGAAKIARLTQMIHESWQNSNLGTEIGEAMVDFAIGTTNVAQEPGRYPGELIFMATPATNIAILPGAGGKVVGWFQEKKKQPIEGIYNEFAKRGSFPDKFMRDLKVEPRREVTLKTATWDTCTPTTYSWQQVAVLEDYNAVVWEREVTGEGNCPWATARWAKTGVDVWGRGCIMNVLPAIKTCNLVIQLVLENAELALGGVWLYDDDGVFNPDNVVLAPGTFIPKSREGKVEPLQSAAQFNVADIVLNDQRTNIKKGLFIDELDAPGKTPRSAFEVQARMAEIARDLSNPGSRLVHELLIPMVNRTINIFEDQGVLDSIGLRVDGKRIKMIVKSPLLRGQDQVELQELMQCSGQIDAVFGQGTAGMQMDRKTVIPYIAKRNGVPPTLFRSDAEIKAEMAQAQAGALATQAASGAVAQTGGDPGATAGLMEAGQAGNAQG